MEKKNKRTSIIKKIFIAIVMLAIIIILATIGIGNYFVNYAILRTGSGGDRKVKNTEAIEVANCKKNKLIIHGAGHTESRYKEPDTYYKNIFEFLDDII